MEIAPEMVTGYINAVANALTDAGHQLTAPTVNADELTAEIVIPDLWTDEHARSGLALLWDHDGSRVAGPDAPGWVAACFDPTVETHPKSMFTALRLGVAPAPDVIVKAVAAIVKDGSLRAGRILPDTADLLARYETTPKWVDITWTPEEVQAALDVEDPEWQFEWCVACGAEDPVYFALFQPEGCRELLRVAWCYREQCRRDRAVPSRMPQFRVVKGLGGAFVLADPPRGC